MDIWKSRWLIFSFFYNLLLIIIYTDVLNVAGHRLGTAEIESALVCHESCSEAAVVGIPNEIKGQSIFAYCCLKEG